MFLFFLQSFFEFILDGNCATHPLISTLFPTHTKIRTFFECFNHRHCLQQTKEKLIGKEEQLIKIKKELQHNTKSLENLASENVRKKSLN